MDWDWLTDWLNAAWQFLVDVLLWLPLKLYQMFVGAILAVLNAIPVPSWAEGLSLDWIPSGMAYFLDPFQVGFGLSCILGAYLWRFIIRRIPLIG